jgi:hypothetical protein
MKSIEVYIKNEEIIVASQPIRPSYPMLSRWSIIPWEALPYSCYTIGIIPEEDRKALEIAQKLSQKTRLELKVYDVCHLEGKLLAYLKGVKKTPTIILNNKKFEKPEELVDLKPE